MKKRKRLLWILIITGAAALAAALVFVSWTKGAFLPSWIQWKEKSLDLSGMAGGSGPDAITLDRRQVNVIYNSESVWQSPDNVLVQDFLWCDIDHDEENELILLCWRIGRYGYARPFWVDRDEFAWSQHIYIYDWQNETIHPVWMASDIGMDALSFEFNDTDRLIITETNGRQTAWDWMSWGLSMLREVRAGSEG